MTKNKSKLHTALIETGKEIEGMKKAPDLLAIDIAFVKLRAAIQSDDLRAMRKNGRNLAALAIKFMIDKL